MQILGGYMPAILPGMKSFQKNFCKKPTRSIHTTRLPWTAGISWSSPSPYVCPEKAAMRGDFLSSFLEDAGIEPQRFRIEWIAGSEGQKFATVIKEMVSELQRLGPIYGEGG